MTDASPTLSAMPAGNFASVALSLLVIVAVILALGWFYGRIQGLRGPRGMVLDVLATQALGPKERVILARVDGKRLIIGVTPVQMQTLYVFDDEDFPVAATEGEETGGFATRLRQALTGGGR